MVEILEQEARHITYVPTYVYPQQQPESAVTTTADGLARLGLWEVIIGWINITQTVGTLLRVTSFQTLEENQGDRMFHVNLDNFQC